MFEAHISVKKEEAPVITLVLLNARILLIFDWLLKAKDFLLQTTAPCKFKILIFIRKIYFYKKIQRFNELFNF